MNLSRIHLALILSISNANGASPFKAAGGGGGFPLALQTLLRGPTGLSNKAPHDSEVGLSLTFV